jgi:hypothetical protein
MSGFRKTQIINIVGALGCAIASVALFSNKIQREPTDAITAPRDTGRSYRSEHTLVAFYSVWLRNHWRLRFQALVSSMTRYAC